MPGGSDGADRVLENLFGLDIRPFLLTGEILAAYAFLVKFVSLGGIGPSANLNEFFDHLSRIALHVVLAVVTMYALTFFPNDTPAEVSAFFFAESIGVVYLVAKIGVAAQITILLKYSALFDSERSWAKIKDLEGVRLSVWFVAMDVLLNPLFVDAPKELRAHALWTDIKCDAENCARERKKDPYFTIYNRDAERFLPAVRAAQKRRARLRLGSFAAGTLLMISGVVITLWLLCREGV